VSHRLFLEQGIQRLCSCLKKSAVFVDVKSSFDPKDFPDQVAYWSL
jgi:hypothetical protein